MFWQLYLLAQQSDASKELKRIRQELEIVRREQQQEREERQEEMRRAAFTLEQRAEEDQQKLEAECDRFLAEARVAEAKRRREEDHKRVDKAILTVVGIIGLTVILVVFVALVSSRDKNGTPYEAPKSNQSTNIQSANPNAQPLGTPVTDKTTSEITKKRGGKIH